jgi:hypothetical protein
VFLQKKQQPTVSVREDEKWFKTTRDRKFLLDLYFTTTCTI